jgi:signal transduction histidine kinase
MTGVRVVDLEERHIEASSQIEAKNNKLESTLKALEDTQTQMLQSEKMASIGQLAAGVAHEINNPTGFVSSNLKTLTDYQEEIAELIGKYQGLISQLVSQQQQGALCQETRAAVEELKRFEQDIDVGFLMDDITDLIGDCREGIDRIKKIVIDLKDFAHPGEDKAKLTDINNGIESTLNVVNNEIKYKASVHKNFGDIPTVRGIPQQLNQVFMNIIANAIDVFDERSQKHADLKVNSPQIRITTAKNLSNQTIEIRIKDNGGGISEAVKNKIFDHLFTTKEVGKGTGLGLSISRQIVEDKHGGKLSCYSEVGQGTEFMIEIPDAIQ